jgi:hypothetical protein
MMKRVVRRGMNSSRMRKRRKINPLFIKLNRLKSKDFSNVSKWLILLCIGVDLLGVLRLSDGSKVDVKVKLSNITRRPRQNTSNSKRSKTSLTSSMKINPVTFPKIPIKPLTLLQYRDP